MTTWLTLIFMLIAAYWMLGKRQSFDGRISSTQLPSQNYYKPGVSTIELLRPLSKVLACNLCGHLNHPSHIPNNPITYMQMSSLDKEELYFEGERAVWYRPTSLEQLLSLKQQHPSSKLVCGNTEIGGWLTRKKLYNLEIFSHHSVSASVAVT